MNNIQYDILIKMVYRLYRPTGDIYVNSRESGRMKAYNTC